ncbi:leucine-rich repeat flightless-interacting protein 1 isoform X5 [Neoarius graeffei]|uniref:leucine-rich repeat flightless-interacting protein 1 isoform X5 n=1 Tax=Neoarius graeffei TaxID=443677 RepID=UPI00298C942B|nr:leucine-rich repeat flightless-interacting protein 1 isoform X5 [Neoarius graeffei]
MGTQVTGRKRIPNREKVSAEDDALSQIAREAEARLAAKRAARAEAREIRLKELERQQKEIYQAQRKYYGLDSKWGHIEQWMISDDEERMSVGSRGSLRPTDYGGFLGSGSRASSRASSARASPVVEERSDFLEKGSRTASTLSAATLASLGGGFSRRGSCDTSISVDTEASMREMKDSLFEAEEKYRKAMVSNAQLDNDKSNLMYQVDTLRDTLMELEELLYETRRECEEKTKECDRERHAHSVLQFQFNEMKETLKQSEELLKALERQKEYSDMIQDERDALRDEVFRLRDALKKHGISLGSEVTNGETGSNMTNGPEHVESAQDTPAMSTDSILERSPGDQVPEMDSTSCMDEKSKIVIHAEVKRAEDMDSGTRASCSVIQMGLQKDYRVPETKEFKRGLSVCVENVPDETVQESVVAQNEGVIKVGKRVNKASKQGEEPWIEENTRVTQVSESPLTRDENEAPAPSQFIKTNSQLNPTTSHANQADEETLEKTELPGTTRSYQDSRKPIPTTDVEMTSSRRALSSSSEQESEMELNLETGVVQSYLLTLPVEVKGSASFLDSCQEAFILDLEAMRLNETDQARVEHPEEMSPAGDNTKHNRMRLGNKKAQDCSLS